MESLGERGAGGMHPKNKPYLFEQGGREARGKCSKMSGGMPTIFKKFTCRRASYNRGYGRVVGGTLFAPKKYVIGT